MTPPIWLDAAGRPRPTRACWTCGREVRADTVRGHVVNLLWRYGPVGLP
jgi:hypothetical protein